MCFFLQLTEPTQRCPLHNPTQSVIAKSADSLFPFSYGRFFDWIWYGKFSFAPQQFFSLKFLYRCRDEFSSVQTYKSNGRAKQRPPRASNCWVTSSLASLSARQLFCSLFSVQAILEMLTLSWRSHSNSGEDLNIRKNSSCAASTRLERGGFSVQIYRAARVHNFCASLARCNSGISSFFGWNNLLIRRIIIIIPGEWRHDEKSLLMTKAFRWWGVGERNHIKSIFCRLSCTVTRMSFPQSGKWNGQHT